MRRALSLIKNELLTGLLLLAPIVGTGYLIMKLASAVDSLLPDELRPMIAGRPLPGLGILFVFALALSVGAFAHHLAGQGLVQRLVKIFDGALQKLPLVGSTYGLMKQVIEAVFSSGSGSFSRAVLVEFPQPGSWVIGFVTQAHVTGKLQDAIHADALAVYVPTTPNPTSGFLIVVEPTHVRELAMNVQQAFKLLLTMGVADAGMTGRWSAATGITTEADTGRVPRG